MAHSTALVIVFSLIIEHIATRHLEVRIGENLAATAHQRAARLDRYLFERYRAIQSTVLLPSLLKVIPTAEGNRLETLYHRLGRRLLFV